MTRVGLGQTTFCRNRANAVFNPHSATKTPNFQKSHQNLATSFHVSNPMFFILLQIFSKQKIIKYLIHSGDQFHGPLSPFANEQTGATTTLCVHALSAVYCPEVRTQFGDVLDRYRTRSNDDTKFSSNHRLSLRVDSVELYTHIARAQMNRNVLSE